MDAPSVRVVLPLVRRPPNDAAAASGVASGAVRHAPPPPAAPRDDGAHPGGVGGTKRARAPDEAVDGVTVPANAQRISSASASAIHPAAASLPWYAPGALPSAGCAGGAGYARAALPSYDALDESGFPRDRRRVRKWRALNRADLLAPRNGLDVPRPRLCMPSPPSPLPPRPAVGGHARWHAPPGGAAAAAPLPATAAATQPPQAPPAPLPPVTPADEDDAPPGFPPPPSLHAPGVTRTAPAPAPHAHVPRAAEPAPTAAELAAATAAGFLLGSIKHAACVLLSRPAHAAAGLHARDLAAAAQQTGLYSWHPGMVNPWKSVVTAVTSDPRFRRIAPRTYIFVADPPPPQPLLQPLPPPRAMTPIPDDALAEEVAPWPGASDDDGGGMGELRPLPGAAPAFSAALLTARRATAAAALAAAADGLMGARAAKAAAHGEVAELASRLHAARERDARADALLARAVAEHAAARAAAEPETLAAHDAARAAVLLPNTGA